MAVSIKTFTSTVVTCSATPDVATRVRLPVGTKSVILHAVAADGRFYPSGTDNVAINANRQVVTAGTSRRLVLSSEVYGDVSRRQLIGGVYVDPPTIYIASAGVSGVVIVEPLMDGDAALVDVEENVAALEAGAVRVTAVAAAEVANEIAVTLTLLTLTGAAAAPGRILCELFNTGMAPAVVGEFYINVDAGAIAITGQSQPAVLLDTDADNIAQITVVDVAGASDTERYLKVTPMPLSGGVGGFSIVIPVTFDGA